VAMGIAALHPSYTTTLVTINHLGSGFPPRLSAPLRSRHARLVTI